MKGADTFVISSSPFTYSSHENGSDSLQFSGPPLLKVANNLLIPQVIGCIPVLSFFTFTSAFKTRVTFLPFLISSVPLVSDFLTSPDTPFQNVL
jgi:hypothetical protein